MAFQISSSLFANIRNAKFSETELLPPHGRGVLCGGISASCIVTGSSDHGLRVWKTGSLEYSRELFSKQFGHKEWVTSVQILSDGRIASAGMDGLICLWDRAAVRCDSLLGHQASISRLRADDSDLLISASYDCTIRVWPLGSTAKVKSKGNAKGQLSQQPGDVLVGPHKNAVLEFLHRNSLVVSGDKDGVLAFWDLNKGKAIFEARGHNKGIGVLSFFESKSDRLVISGGLKDGLVGIWDMRGHKPVDFLPLHKGSVNFIGQMSEFCFLTGSADKKCGLLDIRNLRKAQKAVDLKAGVMAGKAVGELALLGMDDGNLLVVEGLEGRALYGFGCMKSGGVRVVECWEDGGKVLVAGDDPTSLVLDFFGKV